MGTRKGRKTIYQDYLIDFWTEETGCIKNSYYSSNSSSGISNDGTESISTVCDRK
jgi:hypothetical protein